MSTDAPYPLFPKFTAGQIVEFRVWRNTAGRKAKTPVWERHWPAFEWPLDMTELQFAKLVAGGHYELRAYGAPDEQQHMATRVLKYGGTVRESPPDLEKQQALTAPTAHETEQRAIVTIPGVTPELNACFASWQQMVTNYREDSQKATAAILELCQAFITREKSTTLEQQLITDLRAENQKLAKSHADLIDKLQESEIEGVESDVKQKAKLGLAGMAVDAIASKLPEIVKPLLETGLKELLSKPDYVAIVAKAHGEVNAQALASQAAETGAAG